MTDDPGDGDGRQRAADTPGTLAQLILSSRLHVGPEKRSPRSWRRREARRERAGRRAPAVQPSRFSAPPGHALRRHRDVPRSCANGVQAGRAQRRGRARQLERIRARTLVTAGGERRRPSTCSPASFAPPASGGPARSRTGLGPSGAGTVRADVRGRGACPCPGRAERRRFTRTLLVQLARFLAAGEACPPSGLALNVRYLQRRKIPSPVAVASMPSPRWWRWPAHPAACHTSARSPARRTRARSGRRRGRTRYRPAADRGAVSSFPPDGAGARAGGGADLGQCCRGWLSGRIRASCRGSRRGALAQLATSRAGRVLSRVRGLGGIRGAHRDERPVVYLTGSALGSIIPTPGGLGAVEAALTAGLTALGCPAGGGGSAPVLLVRMITFWLRCRRMGRANYLERKHELSPVAAPPSGAVRRAGGGARAESPMPAGYERRFGDRPGHGAGRAQRGTSSSPAAGFVEDGAVVADVLVLGVRGSARALAGAPVPGQTPSARPQGRRGRGRSSLSTRLGGRCRHLLAVSGAQKEEDEAGLHERKHPPGTVQAAARLFWSRLSRITSRRRHRRAAGVANAYPLAHCRSRRGERR